MPDERLGEEICAWIELKENETATEDEIKAFCKAKVSAESDTKKLLPVAVEIILSTDCLLSKWRNTGSRS